MHIFSYDQYFITGLQQVLFFTGLDKSPDIVVFDPGGGAVYITNSVECLRAGSSDTLTHFTQIRCYSLTKNAPLTEYFYVLDQVKQNKRIPLHTRSLSNRERVIIEYYLAGLGKRAIARTMLLSEGAVSNSQLRALRKMNMKNIPLFLQVMRNWCAFRAKYTCECNITFLS
ncbi:TPA: hypothetical protein N2R15_000450 [Citrobacter amalonaticus]|uniref:LuxR C-terminal-related transcriptional regulator n=1 Tax=Citrobacter sp. Ct235 TaxID=2985157 RepID=UPI00257696D9|nr:LuxR C-terminal-related transcriptional regulator [Citrobacter sp. Ct235]EKZ2527323.1 hypothetical protein [Citrobacter farmeri]MDM2738170.1 LuxR family transcriptional regulator [Citrobacter sp. Ct235]HCL6625775.1 hypothetical protein [Citrobacter amalonaticus]